MKTSVEIPDALLKEVRKVAAAEGKTVRALIEEGLRTLVKSRHEGPTFTLRDASFHGKGLQSGQDDSWENIRKLIYEGRGA